MSDHQIDTLYQIMSYASDRSLIHQFTEDETLGGRSITMNSRDLINFGSCSYLGLEHHPALVHGTIEAVQKYGTQFSSSKTYIALGLYKELESLLQQNFGKPVIVSASTTLGHLAALPAIVSNRDAVILDMQVHASVQMAVELLKSRGITITLVRHNDMERLADKIQSLRAGHQRVWYLADGIYSMYGDGAPLAQLEHFLDTYEPFYLYIDDAHGMSWTGTHGRGYVRSNIAHHEKMVLAVSLNKSFAAAGGALILPDEEMATKLRHCGGTLIFSGPIQPPMLGAACASARLHLTDELPAFQQRLTHLIHHTNQSLTDLNLPQFHVSNSPLFFVPVGLPRITANLINRMIADGFYVNPASFPAVPMKRSGVRFMINNHLTPRDIDQMLDRLAYHYPLALEEEGSHCDEVSRVFQIATFNLTSKASMHVKRQASRAPLRIEHHRSITELDAAEWDAIFAGKGNFTSSSLRMIESVFANAQEPENHWDFHYLLLRNDEGAVVLGTFYTCAWVKEDMFSPVAVSRHIETERELDPHYLVTKSILLGSLITKGEHLYLDRAHPEWKTALHILIDHMQQTLQEHGAGQLFLRDFVGDKDEELRHIFLELGLTAYTLPSVNLIEDLTWNDHAGYMERLTPKYRYDVRREILRQQDNFRLVKEKPQTREEIRECYELYCQVQARSLEINVFRLPFAFFESMCLHPDYDVLRLYLTPGTQPVDNVRPVAVMFSHISAQVYFALIVGLDDRYVRSHGAYKQILYQTVWRAWECGCHTLDLAYTADQVKKKVGAKPHKTVGYIQLTDHFNQALLSSLG